MSWHEARFVSSLVDRRRVGELALLALVFVLLLARPLCSPPIAHHGESREGLVVQAIVDRGEWILPRRNGELPSKPPLFHWLAATAALGLGVSDWVVRLPSAAAAWVIACCVLEVGGVVGGRATGWLAVGALLGTVPFLGAAIEARVDMVFSACVTVSLTAFLLWYRSRSSAARAFVYVGAAAAVLAKGPVGAVLPALTIGAFLAAQREFKLVRSLWSTPLVVLAIVVDVSWYLLATAVAGREFLELQLVRENWSRFVGNNQFRRRGHGHTLRLPILWMTQYLPWSTVLIWSVVRRVRGDRPDAVERFLHAWWVVVLFVFTVGAGKRPVYLLPAVPALALLAGMALAALASRARAFAMFGADWRLSLARIAVALAVFDASALLTLQLARESKARRRPLLPFAGQVAELVPGASPIAADASIPPFNRMVLAYRLRRPVTTAIVVAPGVPYLVAAPARVGKWCAGDALLAESGDGASAFALMRVAAEGTGRRKAAACLEAEPSAKSGTDSEYAVQGFAGSPGRWVIPLDDSVDDQVPACAP